MKPFKLLRGRSILIDIPEKPKSLIELSAKDEESILKETAKLWNKLTVYAVGDKVEQVKAGDKVYISVNTLNMETVQRIDIDGKIKLLLNEGDVVIIW